MCAISMTRSEAAGYLLRAEYSPTWTALENLLPHLEGHRYSFRALAEFGALIERDVPAAMAVYWKELLNRAHWAASGSLIRTHRWLSGLFDAFIQENLIAFCAMFRGLIESCADTAYSLGPVAPTLASSRQTIDRALRRELRTNTVAEDIESRLIHFTFARKPRNGEAIPKLHSVETITRYLSVLEGEQPSVRRLYAELCDVVHPGASSIVGFSESTNDDASEVVLTFKREPRLLGSSQLHLESSFPISSAPA